MPTMKVSDGRPKETSELSEHLKQEIPGSLRSPEREQIILACPFVMQCSTLYTFNVIWSGTPTGIPDTPSMGLFLTLLWMVELMKINYVNESVGCSSANDIKMTRLTSASENVIFYSHSLTPVEENTLAKVFIQRTIMRINHMMK